MRLALRRGVLLLVIAGALSACTAPGVSLPFSEPAAAVVDGHTISMKAYQARLEVSRHRDPFTGIPEAVPSPAPAQRLQSFTIEQLVREEIVRQEAEKRGITVDVRAANARIHTLNDQAGATAFATALERRSDQVHLAVIVVLAPAVDLYSPQGTPAWFTKFIDDREAALRRAGKIELKVGTRAGG